MAAEAAAVEAREGAYRLYNEEWWARLKQKRISKAHKIAPGLLDNEDRRILTPTMATTQVYTPSDLDSFATYKVGKSNLFDHSEFKANDNGSPATRGLAKWKQSRSTSGNSRDMNAFSVEREQSQRRWQRI
ncbi:hypothetical protein BGZ99_009957 [Dissophora globulifera]|uniref:Uncharacterized protein n=1 Tax=Dissophora globulifera TaxID=979702 RepID=A0A9P6UMI6_9FUNG|nr:hypothetical protein BGZ99_009957 [Dissophora globulifera]